MQANEVNLTKLVLKSEGGYSNDAGDPGGPTKYGITIADVRKYVKPGATAADVKALTLDQAVTVYDKHYWDAMRCDELPSGIDYVVYDYGINSGVARPPRVLAAILGIPSTGGAYTDALLAKIKAADPDKLVDAVCDERLHFMRGIRNGASWERFGSGWSTRVASVRTTAHRLVKAKVATPAIVDAHPEKLLPAPKATHVDPKLPTKIGTSTVVAGGGSGGGLHLLQSGMVTTIVVAGIVVVVIGGVGYLMYRSQHRKQLEVDLPPIVQASGLAA